MYSICTYVFMHICLYAWMYICMFIYVNIYKNLCICVLYGCILYMFILYMCFYTCTYICISSSETCGDTAGWVKAVCGNQEAIGLNPMTEVFLHFWYFLQICMGKVTGTHIAQSASEKNHPHF